MNIYLKYILKGLFLFIIIYLISLEVFSEGNWEKIDLVKEKINAKTFLIITVVFLIQFVNWGIEALKFRFIIAKKEPITKKEAILAVYTGNATGFFTPDRLGNFIGRFIYLKNKNKKTVTAATMLGNLSQLISTLIFALISFILYQAIETEINLPYVNSTLILSVVFVLLILITLAFYNPSSLISKVKKIKWLAKHEDTFIFLTEFSVKESSLILLYSIARYLLFISQFYLLLNAVGFEINIIESLIFTGLIYLFTTFIPSPMMGNLGTRELFALMLLSNYDNAELALVVSLLIWIINIVFPSILGSILLVKMNPYKNKV